MNSYVQLGLAIALCSTGLQAHDDSYFDAHAAPHGGQVRMAGAYHVEAVVKDGKLVLYVTDHGDQPQSTAGWQGRATLLTAGQADRLMLNAAGDNRLESDTAISVQSDSKIVVVLQPSEGDSLPLSYSLGSTPQASLP